MPQVRKPDQNEPAALSVEQLLRFKKAEQPSQAFWDEFERKMHQRMFQAALERRPGTFRRVFTAFAHSKLFAYATPATAAVIVFGAVVMSPESGNVTAPVATLARSVDMVVQVKAPALNAATASQSSFVSDSLQMNLDNGNFRKVLAAVDMPFASQSGSTRYVADRLGEQGRAGGVLFASTSF
ncbi:MAG: hypothetical protein JW942_07910 [Opitutales bacterium]|nr:hypothetical protein [Opitutales bacterium]